MCQCLAAGSRPAFPTLAVQNPAQIFPGSDTGLALGSLLHVERNERRITPTVAWVRENEFQGLVTQTVELLEDKKKKKHLFVKVLGKHASYHSCLGRWHLTLCSCFFKKWWFWGFSLQKDNHPCLVKPYITRMLWVNNERKYIRCN